MRVFHSMGEGGRVRGKETQPTETAARISQAQLDRLPGSELALTLIAEPVDGGSARRRNVRQFQIAHEADEFPSPPPSPADGDTRHPPFPQLTPNSSPLPQNH